MSEIRYVVRGKNRVGTLLWAFDEGDGSFGYVPRRAMATTFQVIGPAVQAWADMQAGCDDVRIFSVASDGTETPLPTYEQALNALATARDAAETALRAHGARGMGGAPSELEGCPPGALRALLRLLGGAR